MANLFIFLSCSVMAAVLIILGLAFTCERYAVRVRIFGAVLWFERGGGKLSAETQNAAQSKFDGNLEG